MRPSAFLRSLSLRFPATFSPSPVAPLPIRSSFDRQLSTKLNALRCHSQCAESYATAKWLLHAVDTAVATQKMTSESLVNVICDEHNRRAIEDYLEDSIELLDACNRLRERMETVHNYIESLRVVIHGLEGRSEPNATVLARVQVVLDSCEAMERRCAELEKCSSGLRKLGEKMAQQPNMSGTKLKEVLDGSKAIALLACGVLGVALSFKSKRGLPMMQSQQQTSSSISLHELHKEVKEEMKKRKKSSGVILTELRQTIMAARNLRDLMKSWRLENKAQQRELGVNVEELERSCGELEEGIRLLEGRVNELYRHLISVRMALLGILSQA